MSTYSELLDRPSLDLAETPVAQLLRAASAEHRSLAARFRSGLVDKTVLFEDGVPVDCRSNMVQDTLSRFMVRQGVLDREQENQLLQQAAREKRLFGEVAREAGVATADEIYRFLQQNLARKLLDLFTWEEGSVDLFDDVPAVESPLKVNVSQLLLTGCTRFVPKQEVDLVVGHLVGQKLILHPRPPVEPASVRFSAAQRDLIEALREPCGLSELTSRSSLGFEDATRFVYALIVLDLVVPENELDAARRAPIVVPQKPPTVEPTDPGDHEAVSALEVYPEEDPERLVEDVMRTYLQHRRVDARGLLDLDESATPDQIRESFLAYCRRFAPWRFQGPRLGPLAGKAEDLFFAGWHAYQAVEQPRSEGGTAPVRPPERPATTARPVSIASSPPPVLPDPEAEEPLSAGRMIRRAADELAPVTTELLDPDEHFETGLAMMKNAEYTKALDAFEIAVKCDPQNGIYRAEAAWCFYQRSPGTGASAAREQLDKALRVDPGCGLALFYYGELSRLLGEYDVAEDYLRRAIKPMSPDRRPIDKLRDLAKIRRDAEAP